MKRLKIQFSAMAFDASHEQNHGEKHVFDIQFCQNLDAKYTMVVVLCTQFLNTTEGECYLKFQH